MLNFDSAKSYKLGSLPTNSSHITQIIWANVFLQKWGSLAWLPRIEQLIFFRRERQGLWLQAEPVGGKLLAILILSSPASKGCVLHSFFSLFSFVQVSNSDWWKQKTSKKMTLHLEIVSLAGVIVLNIPPPPSDRLWYSFKERPELGLRIVPFYGDVKLGEDNTFFSSAVNKTIEVVVRRLKEEIHKFVLLPNMDDIPIRIMDPFLTTNAPSMDE